MQPGASVFADKHIGKQVKDIGDKRTAEKFAKEMINAIENWRTNKILTAKKRWIFELLQNAIDAAHSRGTKNLEFNIELDDQFLTVKHNAGYFEPDEIACLILADSSKPFGRGSDYIGRFGKGFVVTHVLSPRVTVKGVLRFENQDMSFEVKMDRSGKDERSMTDDFESCFRQLDSATPIASGEIWTEYSYEFIDGLGKEAAEEGIKQIEDYALPVLSFNPIQQITVKGIPLKLGDPKETELATFETKLGEKILLRKRNEKRDLEIGIILENNQICRLTSRANIFVGLPLTDTAEFVKLPFILSSGKFSPTDERDNLKNTSENKELIEAAFSLYYDLLKELSTRTGDAKPSAFFNCLEFQPVKEQFISQNPVWSQFNTSAQNWIGKALKELTIVPTSRGSKTVAECYYPVAKLGEIEVPDEVVFEKFYKICSYVKKEQPAESEVLAWNKVILQINPAFPEETKIYTIQNLKDDLEAFLSGKTNIQSFVTLAQRYALTPQDADRLLVLYFELADFLYAKKLVSTNFVEKMIPSQDGFIGQLSRTWTNLQILFKLKLEDPQNQIPDIVKDLTTKIGRPVKGELVDIRFGRLQITRDCVKDILTTEGLFDTLVTTPQHCIKDKVNLGGDKVESWVELFIWASINKKLTKGFPFVTKSGEVRTIEELDREAALLPFEYLELGFFEEVYNSNRILNTRYFRNDQHRDALIQSLKSYGFIVTSLPLKKTDLTIRFAKLNSIISDNQVVSLGEHRIVTDSNNYITTIPFWDELIGRVSESRERAKLLMRLAVEHFAKQDQMWRSSCKVRCDCREGFHNILPAQWLANLKTDAWVPYKTKEGEGKSEPRRATKESIENLFETNELISLMTSNAETVSNLLPHLGFDDLDLSLKLRSIETGDSEENIRKQTAGFVGMVGLIDADQMKGLVEKHPEELKEAILGVQAKIEQDRTREENKKVGRNVEKIIGKIVRKNNFDFEVEDVGSDLEIWPNDSEGFDAGCFKLSKFLVEVKFSIGTRVHLSKAQSDKAMEMKEAFFVLVVHGDQLLREALKADLGDSISDDLVSSIISGSHIVDGMYSKLGEFPDSAEVEADIKGYWIKEALWGQKQNVSYWLNSFSINRLPEASVT